MAGSAHPRVSVIIPTYNRAALLSTTIASVTSQELVDVEVLVVDDGSTDDTAGVVCGLRDRRIQYIRESNAGRSLARSMGFRVSTGDYVLFLDSDDALLPGALHALARVLDEKPHIDWVAGGILFSDDHEQVIAEHMPWISYPVISFAKLIVGCPMVPSSVLMRRTTFLASGGFDKEVETAEDWDLWIRLARDGYEFDWLQAPVCRYRVHAGNTVTNGAQHVRSMIRALDKVFDAADLSAEVTAQRDYAYARAYVRGACLEFAAGQVDEASRDLERAVALDPSWLADNGRHLFDWLVAGAGSPFVHHPTRFIESVFTNLPESAAMLRQRRHKALGLAAMTTFYRASKQGRRSQVRLAFVRAVLEDPTWLKNRGAFGTWLETMAGSKAVDGLRRALQSRATQPVLADA